MNIKNNLRYKVHSEKIENDIMYLDNVKMRLDIKIIALTMGCVFVGKGIYCKENIKK